MGKFFILILFSIIIGGYHSCGHIPTTPGSSNSGPICMYNPNTQEMNWCFHKTATGRCAHYGGPC